VSSRELSSLILSLGVSVVAAGLLVWHRVDLSKREVDLCPEDATYFWRQDVRRVFVVILLILLAIGIYFGSRIDHRLNGKPNPRFLVTWLAVFWLVIILTVTAMIDWLATRRYARRHRKELVREGLLILRDEMKARITQEAIDPEARGTNGQAHS